MDRLGLCIEFKGGKDSYGYGHMSLNGKLMTASRVSYRLFHGNIPTNMVVMHTCDNPGCINPAHLKLGKQVDNIRDMINKKRQRGAIGERNSKAKLNSGQVLHIRDLYEQGYTCPYLAEAFKVSTDSIRNIIKKRTWSHL